LHYLARYTHGVAISNHRIFDLTDTHVTFRWKDYAHHNQPRNMTLTQEEFLRPFFELVLPKGFPRIRYFGFLANRRRGQFQASLRSALCPHSERSDRTKHLPQPSKTNARSGPLMDPSRCRPPLLAPRGFSPR
jgi:hypothetical protein